MNKKSVLAGVCVAIATSLGLPANAQEEQPQFIEEIVVLATKREQTLQEVPVAVSVVNKEVIDRSQVLDVKDLQFLVPSLRISQLQTTGNVNFLIRGFGNGANNAGIEPSVGVFIDGVYRSRSASALADLPNLERIEVLRGPQSTLFGKNASAGVINVVTAKPDLGGYSGSVSATVGDYDQYIVRGDVTGPLSDTVAFSLSGNMNQRDGYFTNLTTGGEINELDRYGVRGQLLWVPTDRLEFRFIGDFEEIDEACCAVANLLDGPTGLAVRLVGGNLLSEEPYAYANFYDFDPINEVENSGLSMQIDFDINADLTLTSITAMRNQTRFDNSDVDFTSARLINDDLGNLTDTDIDTLTQELRLTGTTDRASWMVGLYYFDEDVSQDSGINYGDAFRAYADVLTIVASGGNPLDPNAISPLDELEFGLGLPPGTFFAEGQGNVERAGMDNQALSIFGQVDFDITDRVILTLGANYTEDDKDAFVNIDNTDVFSGLDLVTTGFALIFQALTGLPPTPANIAANPLAAAQARALSTVECSATSPPPACNQLLALQPLQFLPPFLDYPNSVESGSTSDSKTTWTARLSFDITDNMNLYVGGGTGFKASSWNLSRDSRPFASDLAALDSAGLTVNNLVPGTRLAGPEDSTVYELGLKYFGDTANWNLTVFDQEIDGFQSNIFTGTGFTLANAGKQSTTGVEFDLLWIPVEWFELSFSGTWLDAQYDSFPEGEGVSGPEDLSGTDVAGVSPFNTNTAITFNYEIGSTVGFFRVAHIYEDEVQVIENVPESVASREVNTINASTGLMWDNGFEATIWARNLNNDEYLQSAFPSVAQAGSYSGYPNQPRTYGITVRKFFD